MSLLENGADSLGGCKPLICENCPMEVRLQFMPLRSSGVGFFQAKAGFLLCTWCSVSLAS